MSKSSTGMHVLDNRINSFYKPKRKPGSKSQAFKWPHPEYFTANPETLAEAGFYYDPSPEDVDNVTCYMCGKELSEWAEEDDPFDIHFKKCGKKCSWASVRCGLRSDMNHKEKFVFTDKSRLPTSKTMEKARLETFTFQDVWTHDSVRNHAASSKNMARAGFVYNPLEVGDDSTTCLYCGIALSGWQDDDDPTEEHRKRVKSSNVTCPMFPDIVASKSTSAYQDTTMPTKVHDGENSQDDDDDEAPSRSTRTRASTSTAKTPRASRASKSTAKTPRARARSSSKPRKTTTTTDEEGNLEDNDDEDGEEEPQLVLPKSTRKRTASTASNAQPRAPRSRSVSRSVSRPPSADPDEDRPKRNRTTSTSRSKTAKSAAATPVPSETEEDSQTKQKQKSQQKKTTATKAKKSTTSSSTRSRSKSKSRVSVIPEDIGAEEEDEDQEEEEEEEVAPAPRTRKTSKAATSSTTSKKSTKSKSIAPLYDDEDEEVKEEEEEEPEPHVSKSKTTRKGSSRPPTSSSSATTTTKKIKRTRGEKERRKQGRGGESEVEPEGTTEVEEEEGEKEDMEKGKGKGKAKPASTASTSTATVKGKGKETKAPSQTKKTNAEKPALGHKRSVSAMSTGSSRSTRNGGRGGLKTEAEENKNSEDELMMEMEDHVPPPSPPPSGGDTQMDVEPETEEQEAILPPSSKLSSSRKTKQEDVNMDEDTGEDMDTTLADSTSSRTSSSRAVASDTVINGKISKSTTSTKAGLSQTSSSNSTSTTSRSKALPPTTPGSRVGGGETLIITSTATGGRKHLTRTPSSSSFVFPSFPVTANTKDKAKDQKSESMSRNTTATATTTAKKPDLLPSKYQGPALNLNLSGTGFGSQAPPAPRTPIDAPITAGFVAETASRFINHGTSENGNGNGKPGSRGKDVTDGKELKDSRDAKSVKEKEKSKEPLSLPPRHPLRSKGSYLGSFRREMSVSESDREMQVVEISTDEEDEEDEERRSPSPKKGRKGKGKETEKEREKEKEKEEISGLGKEKEKDVRTKEENRSKSRETEKPPSAATKAQKTTAPLPVGWKEEEGKQTEDAKDVEMSDTAKDKKQKGKHKVAASKSKVGFDQPPEEKQEEDVRMAEANVNEDSKRPTTPPPHSSIPLNPKTPLSKNENTVNTDTSALMTPGFQFMPALSKEPFVNLTSLTEEEAAMTVEEWIKYQMGIEYERFKKDGERELAAFERKADEVRRTIEAL